MDGKNQITSFDAMPNPQTDASEISQLAAEVSTGSGPAEVSMNLETQDHPRSDTQRHHAFFEDCIEPVSTGNDDMTIDYDQDDHIKGRRWSSIDPSLAEVSHLDHERRGSSLRGTLSSRAVGAPRPERKQTNSEVLALSHSVETFLELYDAIARCLAAFAKQELNPFKTTSMSTIREIGADVLDAGNTTSSPTRKPMQQRENIDQDWEARKARVSNILVRLVQWKLEFGDGELQMLLSGTSKVAVAGSQAVRPLLLSIGETLSDLVKYQMVPSCMESPLCSATPQLNQWVQRAKETQGDMQSLEDAASVASELSVISNVDAVNVVDQQLNELENDLDLLINLRMAELLKKPVARQKSRRRRSRTSMPLHLSTPSQETTLKLFGPSPPPAHTSDARQGLDSNILPSTTNFSPAFQHMLSQTGHRLIRQPYFNPFSPAISTDRGNYVGARISRPPTPSPTSWLTRPLHSPKSSFNPRTEHTENRQSLSQSKRRKKPSNESPWKTVQESLDRLQTQWRLTRPAPDLERHLHRDKPWHLTLLVSSDPTVFQADKFQESLAAFEKNRKKLSNSVEELSTIFSGIQIRPVDNTLCRDIVEIFRRVVPKVRHDRLLEDPDSDLSPVSLLTSVDSIDFTLALLGNLTDWAIYTNFPDAQQLSRSFGMCLETILMDEFWESCSILANQGHNNTGGHYRVAGLARSKQQYLQELLLRRIEQFDSLPVEAALVAVRDQLQSSLHDVLSKLRELSDGMAGLDTEMEDVGLYDFSKRIASARLGRPVSTSSSSITLPSQSDTQCGPGPLADLGQQYAEGTQYLGVSRREPISQESTLSEAHFQPLDRSMCDPALRNNENARNSQVPSSPPPTPVPPVSFASWERETPAWNPSHPSTAYASAPSRTHISSEKKEYGEDLADKSIASSFSNLPAPNKMDTGVKVPNLINLPPTHLLCYARTTNDSGASRAGETVKTAPTEPAYPEVGEPESPMCTLRMGSFLHRESKRMHHNLSSRYTGHRER